MPINTIKPDELKKLIENTHITIIDVREPSEYVAEYICGANLIPLSSFSKEKIPENSSKIVIYCRSGKRSANACQVLKNQDAEIDVYSLDGGIEGWKQAGYQVFSAGSIPVLSLERQTQIGVGTIILLLLLLGTIFDTKIHFVIGLIAVGLIYAGLSGSCTLTKLLQKMPWNKK